ncbi:hypothetical protein P8452_70624 [Trifolium repens]|nr:hypothetical protein P8452_70624 [Trifolium repens]
MDLQSSLTQEILQLQVILFHAQVFRVNGDISDREVSVPCSSDSVSTSSLAFSIEASSEDIRTKAAESYHSLPLFMLEQAQCAKSSSTSLAEQFGDSYIDNVPETPNWLSEEMIKCISAIYCELTDSPFCHKTVSSPGYEASSKNQGSKWGSQWKKHSLFNLNSSNPFHVKGSKQFSGPYCSMIKIQKLCTDSQKLKENEYMLRRFR